MWSSYTRVKRKGSGPLDGHRIPDPAHRDRDRVGQTRRAARLRSMLISTPPFDARAMYYIMRYGAALVKMGRSVLVVASSIWGRASRCPRRNRGHAIYSDISFGVLTGGSEAPRHP